MFLRSVSTRLGAGAAPIGPVGPPVSVFWSGADSGVLSGAAFNLPPDIQGGDVVVVFDHAKNDGSSAHLLGQSGWSRLTISGLGRGTLMYKVYDPSDGLSVNLPSTSPSDRTQIFVVLQGLSPEQHSYSVYTGGNSSTFMLGQFERSEDFAELSFVSIRKTVDTGVFPSHEDPFVRYTLSAETTGQLTAGFLASIPAGEGWHTGHLVSIEPDTADAMTARLRLSFL